MPHGRFGVVLGGPVRVATGAGVDVRAGRVSKIVGGERGHVWSLRDVGCRIAVKRHIAGVPVISALSRRFGL